MLAALWASVRAKIKTICLNSWTITGCYVAVVLGLLDEAKVLDWSSIVGAERAGRVSAGIGIAMLILRLRTIIDPPKAD